MPCPESSRKQWRVAAGVFLFLLVASVLALFFWPESPETARPDLLAMPGSAAGPAMASRSKTTALFGSAEGIVPFGEAATRDFFHRLAQALLPDGSTSERSRLIELLMADPDVQRRYREYLRTGRVPDAEELAETLRKDGAADRLLAALRQEGPEAQRMLLQADPKEAAPPVPPATLKPRPPASAAARPSPMSAQIFNRIFSMVAPPKREQILAKMEGGAGVWDACRRAGLTADCNAAVASCRADEGCQNWLRQSGQSLPGGEANWTKTADRKTVKDSGQSGEEAPKPSPAPDATTAGGSTGGGSGGGDGGGDGGGGGGASEGGATSSTSQPTREEICADKPWKPFCPGHEAYEDSPQPSPSGSPPPPPPPRNDPPPERGPRCFIAGTRVSTPRGPVPIEDIRVGDAVYAFDVETGRRVEAPVEGLVRGVQRSFVRLRLADGRSLQVTPAHRFYDPLGRGWLAAERLARGAPLYGVAPSALAEGPEAPLESPSVSEIESLESGPRPVYNLTIAAPYRNYFAEGVLVHNLKDGDQDRSR